VFTDFQISFLGILSHLAKKPPTTSRDKRRAMSGQIPHFCNDILLWWRNIRSPPKIDAVQLFQRIRKSEGWFISAVEAALVPELSGSLAATIGSISSGVTTVKQLVDWFF
jgi:hypothetical protein